MPGRFARAIIGAATLALAGGSVHGQPASSGGTATDAESGSAAPDTVQNVERQRLFSHLKAARTEAEGRRAEDAVWRFWMQAPDAESARLVAAAMRARDDYDFAGARRILDDLVARAPDYAEGWNQRAFIRFLQEDLDGALSDLDRALELEPFHFAAMAGQATILMRQGRTAAAQGVLRNAVAIHPFLKERAMLLPEAPPQGPKPLDL